MSTLKVNRLQTTDGTFSIDVKDIGTGGGGGAPTGPAGGVLSGTYPNPTFAVPMATYADLQNKTFALDKILQSGATVGQAPVWNGTAWVPQNVGGGGGAPSGPAGGVLSGTYPNPGFAQPMATASDLQALANSVATATWPLSAIEQSGATSGQVPYWDGTQWMPQDAAGGIPGPANVLQIGTVTSGPTAEATITGGSPNQTLNLVLPKGDKGNPGTAATVTVGTVTTGAAGSAAAVTNSGNANAAVFNFTIPQGAKGDKGDTGSIPDSGIVPGTYTKATYNSKGQAVSGTNPTTLAGYGITDGATVAQVEAVAKLRYVNYGNASFSIDANSYNTLSTTGAGSGTKITLVSDANGAPAQGSTFVCAFFGTGTGIIEAGSGAVIYHNGTAKTSVTVPAAVPISVIKALANTYFVSGYGVA